MHNKLIRSLWNDRLPIFIPGWMRKRIEVNILHIKQLMEIASQETNDDEIVLDAGAGEGRFFQYFPHAKYISTDFGKGDIDWDYSNLDVSSDIHQLPFMDESIDNIICTQVLEHVKVPQQVINEFGRVLKKGGRLFLSAPQSWHQHQQPHDYFRFTSFALESMFKEAGLSIRFVKPMGGYFWFLSYQLQMMHYWTVSTRRKNKYNFIVYNAISIIIRFIFLLIVPIPLYYLDRLDKTKDMTMGYICYCIK